MENHFPNHKIRLLNSKRIIFKVWNSNFLEEKTWRKKSFPGCWISIWDFFILNIFFIFKIFFFIFKLFFYKIKIQFSNVYFFVVWSSVIWPFNSIFKCLFSGPQILKFWNFSSDHFHTESIYKQRVYIKKFIYTLCTEILGSEIIHWNCVYFSNGFLNWILWFKFDLNLILKKIWFDFDSFFISLIRFKLLFYLIY